MSTPTPRTDRLAELDAIYGLWIAHSRTLERELADAQQEGAHYISVAQKATDELTRLRAENLAAHKMACAAGLERDQLRAELDTERARLDWLVANRPTIWSLEDRTKGPYWLLTDFPKYKVTASRHKTARAAIDAAMKEGAK